MHRSEGPAPLSVPVRLRSIHYCGRIFSCSKIIQLFPFTLVMSFTLFCHHLHCFIIYTVSLLTLFCHLLYFVIYTFAIYTALSFTVFCCLHCFGCNFISLLSFRVFWHLQFIHRFCCQQCSVIYTDQSFILFCRLDCFVNYLHSFVIYTGLSFTLFCRLHCFVNYLDRFVIYTALLFTLFYHLH